MIVLDTNVISELMKPNPDSHVFKWFALQARDSLFSTAVNQAEILGGIALLANGKRREQFEKAADATFAEDFGERILPFDSAAAHHFARIVVERSRSGRPISQADAQIAAISRAHRASLATRNVADFEDCGIAVIDPWKG